jgi:hypothetical protein
MLAVGITVAVLATLMPAAGAFKPYTHAKTGQAVLVDVADGKVTILGREYPVSDAVRDALVDWPEFYNAGVIGPDGFPDLTYGQAVIHSEKTGLWLRHIFDSAWAVQTNVSYTPEQRSQILAFAYGYLMHAAGDTWAHTLVNDFAQGTFPPVGEVLTDTEKAAIALRHIIVEGYIGDATAGYDGNDERGPAPGGDVSDDSSDAIDFPTRQEFAGVSRFLYETLIDPNAATPTTDRGPAIDFFLGLRASLAGAVESFEPKPLDTLVDAWQQAKSRYDNIGPKVQHIRDLAEEWENCAIDDFSCSRILIAGEIVIAAADIGITVSIDAVLSVLDLLEGAVTAAAEAVALAADELFDAYLVAWIDDIDAGLRAWPELGRATTVALFDPQTRRDVQNESCHFEGAENTLNRALCEDGIGLSDVLFDQADPFINEHLLSMLGAPDAVGGLRQALQDLSSELDAILGPLGIPFNPLDELGAQLKEIAKEMVKDVVKDALGLDIDAYQSMVSQPASWLDAGAITVDLPGGPVTIPQLFAPDEHERLDALLGFTGTDHLVVTDPPYPDFPVAGVRLADHAQFTPGAFPAFDNAITFGKLMLLDGATLDQFLSDQLGRPYAFYAGKPGANIMLTPLPGVAGASDAMWLRSIDADHAWRADSQPRFAPGTPSGGEGNFPLWESCALRNDVFRALFADWENGSAVFPDLGDAPSFDPNDPLPPVSVVSTGGTTYVRGDGTVFLGADATLTVSASDDFWRPDEIAITATVTDSSGTTTTTTLPSGGAIDLTALPDGPVTVKVQAVDRCRTEVEHSSNYVIDTTAPVITINSPRPEGVVFDTDDFSAIEWVSDDGLWGSGVASETAELDSAPVTNGYVLDTFLFAPGDHGFGITAVDHLGNSRAVAGSFVVRATAESLGNNLDRALDEGLITKRGIHSSLSAQIGAALRAHERGQHATEHNVLGAFVNHLESQRGKAIDVATADRFIAYAKDLVANGG